MCRVFLLSRCRISLPRNKTGIGRLVFFFSLTPHVYSDQTVPPTKAHWKDCGIFSALLFTRTINSRISAVNELGTDKQVTARFVSRRLSAVCRDATLIAGFFVIMMVVVVVVLHFAFHFRRGSKDIRLGAGLNPMTHRTTSIAVSLFGFTTPRTSRIQSGQRRVRCVG